MDLRSLKEAYGNSAKDEIRSAYGLEGNSTHVRCCNPSHDDSSPSMAWNEKLCSWHCYGCGHNVDVFDLYRDHYSLTTTEAKKKLMELLNIKDNFKPRIEKKTQFKKPNLSHRPLNQDEIELWNCRGIKKETLDDWGVSGFDHPKHGGCSKFFYKDEKGELPYISMRKNAESLESNEKGIIYPETKPILWGIWKADQSKPLVICEGQPDAMAIYQSGFQNVVSVPAGATNFNWIQNCWTWISGVTDIYLYPDNDNAGLLMVKGIKERIKEKNISVIAHDCKDANELLMFAGPEAVLKDITDAIRKPVDGIKILSDHKMELKKSGKISGIATGFKGLDCFLGYLQPQETTILFGRTGEGKSTVISQMICNSIEIGQKVFLYSGEMGDSKIKRWLYRQACGMFSNYVDKITMTGFGFSKVEYEIKPYVYDALNQWMADLVYVLDKEFIDVRKEISGLFKTMAVAVQKYGCKLLIIDNMMSALCYTSDHNANQTNFISDCKNFSVKYGCHLIVVCHPNKTKDDGEPLTIGSISGTSNIANMADLIIGVEKWADDGQLAKLIPRRHGCLKVMKFREEGQTQKFSYAFDLESKRLTEFLDVGQVKTMEFDSQIDYSWRKYIGTTNDDWEM